jgi:flagellar basal body-associated protein FliL
MSKKLKIFLISLIVIAILGVVAYNYIMHGGARNIADEKTEICVDCKAISTEFTSNSDAANKKYLEKAIEVSGIVTAVNDTVVTLNNNVICTFKTADATLKNNQKATIKGRVVGYDDLMGELKLDNCFVIKN